MARLKKAEIAQYKERLEELRASITHSLNGIAKEVHTPDEATGYSQHQADQGTDDFDRTISLEVTNKEYGLLKQINRALVKIEEDTYGVCDITGEDIPVKRLDAVPYATMTVQAQEKLEKGLI